MSDMHLILALAILMLCLLCMKPALRPQDINLILSMFMLIELSKNLPKDITQPKTTSKTKSRYLQDLILTCIVKRLIDQLIEYLFDAITNL